ncbi:MAG TPA: ABC transporter permease, partial [Burkholderiales bacterium]|nr:ABC transporter permease [Burkholderiales bacterium]
MFFPLPTDFLVWFLVAALIAFAFYSSRNPHLAAPWRRVFRSRVAVASAVLLACYLVVGLLDSVHYRPALSQTDPGAPVKYAVEVRSALDWVLAPLRTRLEKTYSAPLATRLHQKETIERPDGSTARDFPRLAHGGAHLKDEAHWGRDVALRILAGLAGAVALWALAVLAGRRTLARRWPQVPW